MLLDLRRHRYVYTPQMAASHSIVDILTWEITVIEMKATILEGAVLWHFGLKEFPLTGNE